MGGTGVVIEGSVSAWASVFNVGNCAIGAGVLSFPYAFRCAGLLGGLLLCLSLAWVELFTLRLLMRQTQKHQAVSYQSLVLKGLGPKYSEAMSWVILLYLFGSCVAYLIIVGDTFGPLLRHYVVHPWDLPAAFGDRRAIIVFSSTLIILPLSLQRTMGALAGVSSLAVTAMLGTTFVVVGKAVAAFSAGGGGPSFSPGAWLPDGVVLFNWDATAFLAAPVMVFAYHCHVQAVPIFLELTDTPTLNPCAPAAPAADDNSMHGVRVALAPLGGGRAAMSPALAMRRLQGMYDVLAAAYVECTVMYLTVGVVGYLLFPLTAAANILNAFALDDPVMQATRFIVGWAVLFHYPINQHVARTAMHDLLCKYTGLRRHRVTPYARLASLTLVFFVAAVTLACLIRDLGTVFQIMGGVAGSLLIFVLPGALLVADAPPAMNTPYPSQLNLAAMLDLDESLLPNGSNGGTNGANGGDPCSAKLWQNSRALGRVLVIAGCAVIVLTLYTTYVSATRHQPPADEAASPDSLALAAQWTHLFAA